MVIEWFPPSCDLDGRESMSVRVTSKGLGLVLHGWSTDAQIGDNDLKLQKCKPPGFFRVLTGSKGCLFYFCPTSLNLMVYPDSLNESLAYKLMIEEIKIPPNAILFGPCYYQVLSLLSHLPDYRRWKAKRDAITLALGSKPSIVAKGVEDKTEDYSIVVGHVHKGVQERILITCRQIPFPMMFK